MRLSNPFNDVNSNKLLNIVIGVIAPISIKIDLENAYEVGDKSFNSILETRLTDKDNLDFFTPIKNSKLKTFSDVTKTVQIKAKAGTYALKCNRNLLTRLLVVAKVQNLNLKDLMKYSLCPVPQALGNYDGSKTKTNKATLLHHLEKCDFAVTTVDAIPSGSVLIIDGMALIQQIKNIPPTFGGLAQSIFKSIIKLSKGFSCKNVDFVTDCYPEISIKQSERNQRASSGIQLIRISHANQKTPMQMKKFLGSGQNKEALIEFLFQFWQTQNPSIFEDVTVLITHTSKCHSMCNIGNGKLLVENVPELESDHEEADTRLFLHAAHASGSYNSIIIKSPDTDVLVLCVALVQDITSPIYFVRGTSQDLTVIDATSINQAFGLDICKALLGLHVFTGCDSVSCFKGKSKVIAFKNMIKSSEFISAFKELGSSWTVSMTVMDQLEQFTCQLYGQNTCKSIDQCRYNWLRLGCTTDSMLPPNKDSLSKHVLRANNYQTDIY